MKAKSNELTVDSMTQRYSLGHKALSVALSVVLMGFGWPAVSPSQVYAGDGAAVEDTVAQAEGTSSAAATSAADKSADTAANSAAPATSSAAPAASEQPASTTSQQQAAPSASEPAQPAGTQQDKSAKEDADTADVELVLGNASITYMNQVVSAPAHKVTVPVKDDFKFTVSPDNGYSLTKAVLKVSGKENPISPDDQGVYTVSAADVAAGATVTLETEAIPSESGKDAAVSIEDEAAKNDAAKNDAAEGAQVSASDAGAITGPTSIAQGDEVTLADSTKKPDNTDFEKWIYVGETATYQGTSGNEWSNYSSWWYPGKDEGFISFEKDGDSVTVTGQAKGDVVLMHGYWNSSWQWITEKFTIHVLPKAPITSLEITDSDTTVEQFKSITLKTNADTDVTWTSSDPSVATIDAAGKVVGVKPGKVTIVATAVTAEDKVLTATHEVTVTESTAQQINAKLFFLKSPTNNPDSNSAGDWFPTGGQSNLGVKVNVEGAAFSGQNTWDNVANRVVKWPDGSAGSSWTLPQGNSYWDKVFDSYKSEIEDKLHVSISKDDVEAIVLHPYKISNNSGIYHLDCKVEIKVKQVVTATFWLQSAGATGFDKQYSVSTLEVKDGAAQVVAPAAPEAEKTVDGVTYKFMGWYSDKDCTQPVTFPVATAENVFYYGKYVPCDQSIQVNYYLDKTNTPVAPSQTLTGYMKGQKVTQTPIDIPGYTPVSTDAKSGVVGTDSSINFFYTANLVGYRVEYYWTGPDTLLSSENRSGYVGDQITGLAPKAIAGYTPVSDNVQDLKLGADETQNVVKFYYRQNVWLKANFDSKIYNGSEQGVDGYTSYTTNPSKRVSTSFDGVTLEGGKGTNAGDYPYTFADGTIGKVSSDNNYVVTQTTPGKLHISPVADEVVVKIAGKAGTEKYNGKQQTVSGWDVTEAPGGFDQSKVTLAEGATAEAKGKDAGTYYMGLTAASFVSADGNYAKVKFEVVDGKLEITKRKVTLWSEDGHKNYDGRTLQRQTDIRVDGTKDVYDNDKDTTTQKTFEGDGFVEGEGVNNKNVTWFDENNIAPGCYDNKFECEPRSGTNFDNYEITYEYGKLYVNKRADNKKYEVTVKGASGTSVYDGQRS